MSARETPGGFFLADAPEGALSEGARAIVASDCVLDWPHRGRVGRILGYSKPHGFAILDSDGEELLVHPESLQLERTER